MGDAAASSPVPVVLVTTRDDERANVMTISWTMVVGIGPCMGADTAKLPPGV